MPRAERRSNHRIQSDASSIKKEKSKIKYLLRFWWIVLKVRHKKKEQCTLSVCGFSLWEKQSKGKKPWSQIRKSCLSLSPTGKNDGVAGVYTIWADVKLPHFVLLKAQCQDAFATNTQSWFFTLRASQSLKKEFKQQFSQVGGFQWNHKQFPMMQHIISSF